MRRLFLMLAVCCLARTASAETAPLHEEGTPCRKGATRLARVDLFFGMSARHGSAAWRRFLVKVVTPRFPDGLTVLKANGQWRGPDGIEREGSRVVIILYRPDRASDGKIEEIRSSYKARFRQRSVLRIDSNVCASF